jgi:hypothetical protein
VPCAKLENTHGVVGPEVMWQPDVTSGLWFFRTSGCLDGNISK